MKKTLSLICLGAFVLVGSGCNKLKGRDELNQGIAAFKGQKYAAAVDHFKSSAQLDPENMNGRLYLATAYMMQYIPGADSPENLQMAKAS